MPITYSYTLDGSNLNCAFLPAEATWGAITANGCPAATATLAEALGTADLLNSLTDLGLFTAPPLRLPSQSSSPPESDFDPVRLLLSQDNPAPEDSLLVSPLQMALAAAALSNQGIRPAPLLVLAVDTPQSGWVMLPSLVTAVEVFSAQTARAIAEQLADPSLPTWRTTACVQYSASDGVCWYLGGTRESWAGTPFALAVLLENPDPELVTAIGREILETAITP